MSRIISGTYSGITLASGNNPVTVTGTISGSADGHAGNAGANPPTAISLAGVLYGPGNAGQSWTISNSGTIQNTGNYASVGIELGEPGLYNPPIAGNYVTGSSITNLSGGLITASDDGINIEGSGNSVTNDAKGTVSGGGFGISLYGGPNMVVNAGLVSGQSGVHLNDGGTVINQAGGTISGTKGGVYLDGYYENLGVRNPGDAINASTLDNAGTISGSGRFGAVDFYHYSVNNRLIDNPGAVFKGGTYDSVYQDVTGNGGTMELASGSSAGVASGFGTNFTGFGTLQFDAGAKWTVSGSASGFGTTSIMGFTTNDTIDVTGFTETKASFSADKLVLTNSSNGKVTLDITSTSPLSDFQISTGDGNTFIEGPPCFLPGTHILTDCGEVLVEKLQVGDTVVTLSGQQRRLCWIGQGHALATRGRRTAATPVIVRKGALADNVPHRDLHITKGHSLYLDGVLIPVEFLVNHRTILWDDRAQEVTVYHLELDTHDVLVANGAPAESYRDDGNRWLFGNANEGWDQPAKAPCAPVLTGGAVVDGVWRRILDRAGPRPGLPLTDDPDLHLLVDGARVDAVEQQGPVHVFRLTDRFGTIHIASREAVPAELGLARDPRSLGVGLRRVAVRQGTKFVVLKADDARLADGFHPYEATTGLRWTDGRAALPAETFTGFTGDVEVVVHLAATTRYPNDGADAGREAA